MLLGVLKRMFGGGARAPVPPAGPDRAQTLLEEALAHKERGEFEAAIVCLDEIIAAQPEERFAHTNRGLALRELGRHAEAEGSLRRALELSPLNPDLWAHLALVLIEQGRSDEAIAILEGILAQMPDHVEAHWNLALARLRRGEFAAGWPHYEYRRRRADVRPPHYPYPEWTGGELGDGALLIVSEQGPGDEIMFASCIPDAMARVARVAIECDPRLAPLFARSFPGASVWSAPAAGARPGAPPDCAIKAQIMAGSLPGLFRCGREAFPQHPGYLRPDSGKVERWRTRLAGLGPGLRIGVSWRGGTFGTRRRLRSLSLAALLPVLRTAGAQFVSLQHDQRTEEIADLHTGAGVTLHAFPEAVADFDEQAALMSCLDLVISVQTAVVHLAGALGRPCWVLVPAVPEWRYLGAGERMPWYPSVRLFRQETLGVWEPLVERVAGALRALRP